MKTIGLLGGMSWESTVTYYQIVNRVVKETLGGLHSAQCVLYSVDFHDLERCLQSGDWDRCAAILSEAAQRVEQGGADFLLICTNTMHKIAQQIQDAVSIPLIHIADITADALMENGITTVGLLGTRYTMEQDFFTNRIAARGIAVLTPDEKEREEINRSIFQELCLGRIEAVSKQRSLEVIDSLAGQGAQGIILGCTEIGMLIQQEDTGIPLFDTTVIHATKAARMACE